MEQHHKKKIARWSLIFSAGLIVLLVISALWLYTGVASGARLQALTMLGAPLGTVGSEYISARDVNLFTNAAVGDSAAGLPALVDELKLVSVAAGRSVRVTSADVERAAEQLRTGDEQYYSFEAEHGRTAALKVLATPYVYKNFLRIEYLTQGLEPALTQQLQTLSGSLRTDEDWKEVASTYSDDLASFWSGGDVGYVDLSQAIPEYAQAVQGLPLHNPAVIYTRYGAHIVEVLNRVSKDGKELTQLREIVLRPKHFDTWLAEQTSAVPVKWYVQVPTSIE